MREISVLDETGRLRETMTAELEIYRLYPENDVDRAAAFLLLNFEYDRWQKEGCPEKFEFSEASFGIIQKAHDRIGQQTVCGLVGLAMCALENAGINPSIERAALIVSEYINNSTKDTFTFELLKQNQIDVRTKKLISDIPTIKRIFRKYRSVSSLCTAMIAVSEHLEFEYPFTRSKIAPWFRLSTVLYYQERFFAMPKHSDWRMWRITRYPEFDPALVPPYTIESDFAQMTGIAPD